MLQSRLQLLFHQPHLLQRLQDSLSQLLQPHQGQSQLLLQFQLLLQLQLLPLLKPQLLQPSLLILSLCSLLLDNSNPSLLQMPDQFKLHSILMLSR